LEGEEEKTLCREDPDSISMLYLDELLAPDYMLASV
jgi:hypothetical protein